MRNNPLPRLRIDVLRFGADITNFFIQLSFKGKITFFHGEKFIKDNVDGA
jgi:hypothetical protein